MCGLFFWTVRPNRTGSCMRRYRQLGFRFGGVEERSFTLLHLIVIVVILAVIGCLVVGALIDTPYAEGYRDGRLQKLSHKGVFVKTWEAEVAMPGFRQVGTGDHAHMSNVWECSVADPSVVAAMQALRGDQLVRFHYQQVAVPNLRKGATTYFVTRVEVLE